MPFGFSLGFPPTIGLRVTRPGFSFCSPVHRRCDLRQVASLLSVCSRRGKWRALVLCTLALHATMEEANRKRKRRNAAQRWILFSESQFPHLLKMGIGQTYLRWLLSALKKIMHEKYLALVQARSKCSINMSSSSFLLLIRWQSSTMLGFLKLPLPVRSKHRVCRKMSDQNRRKGVKQNYCLTGMCAVALYWFYIWVSLRILSGACKCEIGKRHSKTATSHRTGDIKGGGGGNRVGQGKGEKDRGRKERKVNLKCGRTKRYGSGKKQNRF